MVQSAPRAIGDYGLIGDTRTAALVTSDGAIDWMCVPHFDGSPLFGQLIGGPAAGSFRAGPTTAITPAIRRYRPGTATLETAWDTATGRLTLTEGMVAELDGRFLPTTFLVRRLSAEGGSVEATIFFDPRLGDAHDAPRAEQRRRGRSVPGDHSLSRSTPISRRPFKLECPSPYRSSLATRSS